MTAHAIHRKPIGRFYLSLLQPNSTLDYRFSIDQPGGGGGITGTIQGWHHTKGTEDTGIRLSPGSPAKAVRGQFRSEPSES